MLWALLSVLSACTPRLTLSPTVYVDTSLGPVAVAGIRSGLRTWHAAVPEFMPAVVEADRADMLGLILDPEGDEIYVTGAPCPRLELPPTDAAAARVYATHCTIGIDTEYVATHGERWAQVTLHEVGHCMGLALPPFEHYPPPSVMAADYGVIADAPTGADVARFRAVWGLRP